MVAMITTGLAEMTVYMPISGSFIRFAGTWVDEAWGFMTGYNFFFYASLILTVFANGQKLTFHRKLSSSPSKSPRSTLVSNRLPRPLIAIPSR
jgi:amino acid permease